MRMKKMKLVHQMKTPDFDSIAKSDLRFYFEETPLSYEQMAYDMSMLLGRYVSRKEVKEFARMEYTLVARAQRILRIIFMLSPRRY